jgi:hypothetical protein
MSQPQLRLEPHPAPFPTDPPSGDEAGRAAVAQFRDWRAAHAVELLAEAAVPTFGGAADSEHAIERDPRPEDWPQPGMETVKNCEWDLGSPERNVSAGRLNLELRPPELNIECGARAVPQIDFDERAQTDSRGQLLLGCRTLD